LIVTKLVMVYVYLSGSGVTLNYYSWGQFSTDQTLMLQGTTKSPTD